MQSPEDNLLDVRSELRRASLRECLSGCRVVGAGRCRPKLGSPARCCRSRRFAGVCELHTCADRQPLIQNNTRSGLVTPRTPENVHRPGKCPCRTVGVQKVADGESKKACHACTPRTSEATLWQASREKLLKTGRWAGPRKFGTCLEWFAKREMDKVDEADAATIPSA